MTEDEHRQLAALHAELLREYGERYGADAVSARLTQIVAEFEGAPVRAFVPLLAQRRVRQELRETVVQA